MMIFTGNAGELRRQGVPFTGRMVPGQSIAALRRNAAANRLAGLSEGDCPTFAPILWPDGTCSNYPFGGSPAASSFVQTPYTGASVPQGYLLNPYTGVVEVQSAIQAESWAHGSGAMESTRAAAEAEAAEAERLGRSHGKDVQCTVQANCGPSAVGGNPGPQVCGYWADCVVDGVSGHDAGLLLAPGGFENAVISSAHVSGHPLDTVPVLPNAVAVPYVSASGAAASHPSAAAVAAPVGPSVAAGSGGSVLLPSGEQLLDLLPDSVADTVSGMGVPLWALGLVGAVGLVMLLRGGK